MAPDRVVFDCTVLAGLVIAGALSRIQVGQYGNQELQSG